MNTSAPVINFGKFKGTAITELTPNYINWLLTLDNLNVELRKSLELVVSEREHQFQRRKALAISLQSSHIPSYERKAYKHNRGRGWTNSTGWN